MIEVPSPDILGAWEAIRKARSYTQIVTLSNTWLHLLAPKALRLGLAPRGERDTVKWPCLPPPRVIICEDLFEDAYGAYYGHRIGVASRHRARQLARREGVSLLASIRETVLHEAQHFFDDFRGLYEDSLLHGHWFNYRLDRMRSVFPVENA